MSVPQVRVRSWTLTWKPRRSRPAACPERNRRVPRAVALVAAMALPAAAASGAPTPAPARAAKPAPAAPVPPESHPKIREALASLRASREDLEHAAHDFGGHRVDA